MCRKYEDTYQARIEGHSKKVASRKMGKVYVLEDNCQIRKIID